MIHVGSNVYSMYNGSNRVKIQTPLPDDYIECGWIASKNNSYIDTGVCPKASYSLEITAKYWEYSGAAWYTLFGCRNGTNSAFLARDNNNLTQLGFQYSTGSGVDRQTTEININRADRGVWRKYGLYKNSAKIDAATKYTFTSPTNSTAFPRTIYLSADNITGTTSDWGHFYIKDCKIWDENNTVIRDYIPAYKISTQKFGLYDRVNGTFTSSGSANEFVGPSRNHTLPDGYTEVDFVRFPGSAYIELPETFSQTDAVEVEWKWNDCNTVQQRVFSSTPSGTAMLLYINGSKGMSFNYGAASNWVVLVAGGADVGRNWCKIDGYNKTLTGRIHATDVSKDLSSYTEVAEPQKLVIGTRDDKSQISKMDLYKFKKWENNVLVREFVPCYNSSNVYGFYDIIKNEFVTATVGTLQGGYIKD